MAATLAFTEQIAPGAASVGLPAGEQARSALARLQRALAARELRLEDLLRLRLFMRDLGELPAVEAALDARIGSQRPAMSVVELPASTGDARALTLDAVAAPGAREQRRLGPHSARLGPWVFLGAVTALAPRRDLPRGQRVLEEPRTLFAHVERLLGEQGAELRDVVKVGGWLTFPMRDYGPLGQVRDALADRAGLMPASAGVQVARAGLAGELLALEAIAFAPEDGSEHGAAGRERAREGGPSPSRLARFYADARAAGGYVFTSGEVPDGRGPVRTQAAEAYERLRSHLAGHGASPADVLHQTVFARHARDRDVLAETAREFYGEGAPLPPTTLLAVADIGFRPGCDVEIELVAATDRPSTDAR